MCLPMVPNLNTLSVNYRVFPAMSTCFHGYTMWLVCAHSKEFQTPRGLSVWSLHGLHLGVKRTDLTAMIWPLVCMWMVVFEARDELAARPHLPLAQRQLGSFFSWKYGILKLSLKRVYCYFSVKHSRCALQANILFTTVISHPKFYYLKKMIQRAFSEAYTILTSGRESSHCRTQCDLKPEKPLNLLSQKCSQGPVQISICHICLHAYDSKIWWYLSRR